jgi:hypothetical protein
MTMLPVDNFGFKDVLGALGSIQGSTQPQYQPMEIISNGGDAGVVMGLLGQRQRGIEADQANRSRQQELEMRKADRARKIKLQNRKIALEEAERARQQEQQARLGRVLSDPTVLGNLSRNLGIPPELISGAGVSELGALGQIAQLSKPPEAPRPIIKEVDGTLVAVDPVSGEARPVYESESEPKPRRIIEQDGINYYVDTGERVIPASPQESVQSQIPYSLPRDIADPLAVFKDKEKAQIKLLDQSEQKITKMEEGLGQERQVAERLQRFLQLQDIQDTGKAQYRVPIIGYIDPELQEMEAIQSEIAPKMRQVGSGSSSDRDVEMFKRATVSPTNKPQTNRNVANARIAAARNNEDMAQFMREFQSAYGHTKGAEKSWKEYLERNPIFDERSPKSEFKLNNNRLNYRDYFTIKNSPIPFRSKEEVKQAYEQGKLDAGLASNILKIHFGMN